MQIVPRLFAPAALVLIAGCTPQSAKIVEGQITGFLSANSSFTLIKGNFDPSDVDDNWNVDCRILDADSSDQRLEDPLPMCQNASWDEDMTQSWMFQDAWRGFQMPLDPWRGEGILTHEGDLQVGFHQRLPGGEDFRFAFAIRPDFQPTTCAGGEGNVTAEPIDGDWLGEWSKDLAKVGAMGNLPPFLESVTTEFETGTLYYLNARAYQLNPDKLDDIFDNGRIWTLPEQWRAGFARATFVEEDMHSRPTYYGTPSSYLQADNDLLVGVPPDDIYFAESCVDAARAGMTTPGGDCDELTDDETSKINQDMRDTRQEFNLIAPEGIDVDYMPMPHINTWRRIDDDKAGLDAWGELNHSWVVLSDDSDPTVGGSVNGAFSILLDPDDSNSRIIVQGTFEIPRVRKERWAGPDLRVEKLEEAGITPCIDK